MNYKNDYLNYIDPEIASHIKPSIEEFETKYLSPFLHGHNKTGLLLGHVQSGKTSQVLGIISAAADLEFKFFIILTSCNNRLQEQTYLRAHDQLQNFNVCDESHQTQFSVGNFKKPTLVVLKKDNSILSSWLKVFSNCQRCSSEPIFLIDDESDNASLNTKINNNAISSINKVIRTILEIPPFNFYLQVTATPYANLLQENTSIFKPEFIFSFLPGKGYLGGEFFYNPESSCIHFIDSHEQDILLNTEEIPGGLLSSIVNFIFVCIEMKWRDLKTSNFLIHPSIRQDDHQVTEKKVHQVLDNIKEDINGEAKFVKVYFRQVFNSLNLSKDFDEYFFEISTIIPLIHIYQINSSNGGEDYSKGYNIVIGGNSLGRGVTFPRLLMTYYCRQSRLPQMDTMWQHSRLFGYDRIPELCFVYLPEDLQQVFWEFTQANKALFEYVNHGGDINNIQILHPKGTRATRKNVVNQNLYQLYSGGVNYFINSTLPESTKNIDKLLEDFNDSKGNLLSISAIIKILDLMQTSVTDDKSRLAAFRSWLKQLGTQHIICNVHIRRDRNLKHNFRAMLSENDLKLSNQDPDELVVFLYRLNCKKEDEGWDGQPRWVPNIKFPVSKCFSSII